MEEVEHDAGIGQEVFGAWGRRVLGSRYLARLY